MRKHKLWMSDIVFTGDNIIFSSGQFNGLFRAEIYGGEAEFINFFPNDPKMQARLHGDAFIYKDEVLFLPDLSDYITLYNIRHNEFMCMKFPIESKNPAMKYWPKVVTGILVNSCVYAFCAQYPCVVCYDFETKQLKIYDEGLKQFKMYGYREETVFFSRDIYCVGNSIFVRSSTKEVIVEFDIETGTFALYQIGKKLTSGSYGTTERMWLIEEDGKTVYAWNKYDGILERIEMSGIAEGEEKKYQCSIFFRNKIWLFPYFAGSVAIIDLQSGKVDEIDLFETNMSELYKNDALGAVWFRKVYKHKLYFMSVLENKLYCFSDGEDKDFCTEFYTDRNKMIKHFQNKENFYELKEEKDSLWKIKYDLQDVIILEYWDKAERKKTNVEFGKAIYDYLVRG